MATRDRRSTALESIVSTDVDPLDEQFRSQLNILLILAARRDPRRRRAGRRAGPPAGAAARAARRTRRPDRRRRLQHATDREDAHPRDRRHRHRARDQLATRRHDARQRAPLHRRRHPSTAHRHHRHRDAVRDPEHAPRARRGDRGQAPGWPRPTSSTRRSTSCWRPPATARRRNGCRSISTALVNHHAVEWQPRFSAVRRHLSVITAARRRRWSARRGSPGR